MCGDVAAHRSRDRGAWGVGSRWDSHVRRVGSGGEHRGRLGAVHASRTMRAGFCDPVRCERTVQPSAARKLIASATPKVAPRSPFSNLVTGFRPRSTNCSGDVDTSSFKFFHAVLQPKRHRYCCSIHSCSPAERVRPGASARFASTSRDAQCDGDRFRVC